MSMDNDMFNGEGVTDEKADSLLTQKQLFRALCAYQALLTQKKLFRAICAYQGGKISNDKVSDRLKHLAKSIPPDVAEQYASDKNKKLSEELHSILRSPTFIEKTLREIVSTKTPAYTAGVLTDVYTAELILTVLDNLNEDNKREFLSISLAEMVSVSYKMLLR